MFYKCIPPLVCYSSLLSTFPAFEKIITLPSLQSSAVSYPPACSTPGSLRTRHPMAQRKRHLMFRTLPSGWNPRRSDHFAHISPSVEYLNRSWPLPDFVSIRRSSNLGIYNAAWPTAIYISLKRLGILTSRKGLSLRSSSTVLTYSGNSSCGSESVDSY